MVKSEFKVSTGGMLMSLSKRYNILGNILALFHFLSYELFIFGSEFENKIGNELNHETNGLQRRICALNSSAFHL